jgi:hypothetical protein
MIEMSTVAWILRPLSLLALVSSCAQPSAPAGPKRLAASYAIYDEDGVPGLSMCADVEFTIQDGDDGDGFLDAFLAQGLKNEKATRIEGRCSSLQGKTPLATCRFEHVPRERYKSQPWRWRVKDVAMLATFYDPHTLEDGAKTCLESHADWHVGR